MRSRNKNLKIGNGKQKIHSMMKKILTLFVIGIYLGNTMLLEVQAVDKTWNIHGVSKKKIDKVYVDGIEFDVDFDIYTGNVIISGKNKISSGAMILEPDGNAHIEIKNCMGNNGNYELKIEDMSRSDIDIKVYNKNMKLVDKYNRYEEVIQDVYQGQEAISFGVFAITGAILITAAVATGYVIYKSNILYIMAQKFYQVVRVASEVAKKKARQSYYPAYITKNIVYVSPKGISLTAASKVISMDGNVYAFTSARAKKAITKAGFIACNSNGEKKSEIHKRSEYVVFRHWHKGKVNSKGSISKSGSAHALFGAGR